MSRKCPYHHQLGTSPCDADAGATQLVLEELLMTDVQMHPFELLSWEGVFGTIFMVFALLVLNVMPGARAACRCAHATASFCS